METIKAIIFDCFGVLYPDAVGHLYQRHEALIAVGAERLAELDRQIDLAEIDRATFFAELEKLCDVPAADLQAEIDTELVADKKLIKLIQKLKPRYKIGLLSNAGKEEIAVVYRDKIDGLFDAITVSYETQTIKPEPEIFLTACQRLGVEPSACLFVDDNPKNIAAAQKLNMHTMLYATFGSPPAELCQLTH